MCGDWGEGKSGGDFGRLRLVQINCVVGVEVVAEIGGVWETLGCYMLAFALFSAGGAEETLLRGAGGSAAV